MKLALGTVQFGLAYGISNRLGKVEIAEVEKILAAAQANDIELLDTGCVYGTSEQVLGSILPKQNFSFKVVDKIPDMESQGGSITAALERSLEHLNQSSIYGLMLHNAADLCDRTYAELQSLKSQGLVNNIGISVYHPKATFDLETRYDLDLVQLPMNLFDQRFFESGCIDWLKEKGVEVHVRSLFLQGLILMDRMKLPHYFDPYQELFERLDVRCRELKISKLVAALTLAHQHSNIDHLVIGVCSVEQLNEVIAAYEQAKHTEFDAREFSCHEEGLISPFLWPQER